MKIVKPSHQRLRHDCTPYEFIERIGRTCYKSTDAITEGSAVKFVSNLMERGHWAMMEHETVYLVMPEGVLNMIEDEANAFDAKLSFFNISHSDSPKESLAIMSGNLRSFYDLLKKAEQCAENYPTLVAMHWLYTVLVEEFELVYNSIELIYIPDSELPIIVRSRDEFTEMCTEVHNYTALSKHLTHTVLFRCDRGVSHELVRHRPVSFAQESTRYCNYSKDKFGNEITVIEPFFYKDKEDSEQYNFWKLAMEDSEKYYFRLLELGSTPQEARSVLPNSLKTEIIMTATEDEWQHIINLRAKGMTGAPHPQMKELMEPWYNELKALTTGRIS